MSYSSSIFRAATVTIYLVVSAGAAAAGVSEEDLRAAYLFNFASLVEWPSKSLPAAATQLTVCLVGEDDALNGRGAEALARLGGRKINDREVVFKRLQSLAEIKGCHIALIGELERGGAVKLAEALRGGAVLTVAMERDAISTSRDIAICLAIDQDRMVFQVNDDYARRAGLTFSSKLLRLARKTI